MAEHEHPAVTAPGEHGDRAARRGHHRLVGQVEADAAQRLRASSCGDFVVPLVNSDQRQPAAGRPAGDLDRAGQRPSPRLRRSPRTRVPSRSKTKPRTARSRSRRPSGRLGRGRRRVRSRASVLLARVSSSRKPGLSMTRPDSPGAVAQAGQQVEHGLQVRVVVPPGRAGGEHRVDLAGRHGRAEQEFLVADPGREALAQFGEARPAVARPSAPWPGGGTGCGRPRPGRPGPLAGRTGRARSGSPDRRRSGSARRRSRCTAPGRTRSAGTG